MKTFRILATTIAAAALVCRAASPLHAADRFWFDPFGGPFSSTSNWSATNGGVNGASVPGAADIAYFLMDETFTVTFSGAVTNADLDVSDGNVTFDLNGNTYTLTGASGFSIGRIAGETGRLTVRDGVVTTDDDFESAILGLDAGSTGFLTVTADGRIGNGGIRPSVTVGFNGTGTLVVNDNGRIDGSSLNIGSFLGGVGTATITGPSAVVDTTNQTSVGSSGTGTLNVTGGGTLINGAAALIGGTASGNGTATVSGLGSLWTNAGTTDIGHTGEGVLTISSGGRITAASTVTLGSTATGFGTATVTGAGSRWELSSTQVVGASGLGVLTISSGGEIASASSAIIGSLAGGEGRATVTGAGSHWTLGAPLTVGSSGDGELTISAGGAVSATQVTIGNLVTGTGLATVTGSGSRLTSATTLTIANSGSGTLHVTSGGEVQVGTSLNLNDPAGGAVGTLDFDGGLITATNVTRVAGAVFNWTDGTLRIVDGSFNNAGANLTINGADAGDLPTLELTQTASGSGFGPTTLAVGTNRRGALSVTGGSVLDVTDLVIGTTDGGEGTVTVGGNSSELNASSDVTVGGSTGGTGTLNIEAGATVAASAFTTIWAGGTVNLNGGTLDTLALTNNTGQFHFNSGTVRFTGGGSYIGNFNSVYDALLGPEHRLLAGRTIAYNGSFSFSPMNLIVEGGTLSTVGALTVGANSVLEMRSGNITASTLTTNAAALLLLEAGSLALTTTVTNAGELRLATTTDFNVLSGTTLTNTGLIHGNGQISMALTNNSAGQVRAEAGDRLVFTGASSNSGAGRFEVSTGGDLQFTSTLANNATIDVIGGTFRVDGALTNAASTGRITGRDAILRFNGGLTNNGSLAFSFGTSNVFGDITVAAATGRIVISGNSNATFYDDLVNSGTVQVSAGSTAVYFGAVSGAGSFPGGGTNFFEGDLAPGASPALVTFGGNVVYGTFLINEMELGGTVRGTEYDAMNVAGNFTFGGTLDVPLISGFVPQGGNVFNLFDWGTTAGTFSTVNLPALIPGLQWSQANLYTAGEIQVALDPAFTGRVWDGGGANNDWATDNNWDLNVEPLNNGTGQLVFAGNVRLTPSVDTPWNVASITFDNTAGAFTVTGPQGVTVGAGGIVNNDAQTQTITAAITLGANESFNAAAGDLSVSSVNLAGRTLTLTGANDIALAGASGTGTIEKENAGTLNVSGALGAGGVTLNADIGTTNIGASQTLAALNIAAGATVVFGDLPPPFALASAPEPGSALLALLGAGLLGSRRRRRGQ